MVFSSSVFLLLFLPIVIAIYYNPVVKARAFRNAFLLFASLLFYAWGEPIWVFIMLAAITANWALALNINKPKLIIAIVLDLSLLFVFKYLNFVAENLGLLLSAPDPRNLIPQIALPIGLSFFTFSMISYMVDVYRGTAKAQKNILYCALYIAFFSKMLAGPIVRYTHFEQQINGRKESWDDFCEGFKRFTVGLGKKLLLASNCALAADAAFDTIEHGGEIGIAFAWLGAIAYTLQLYFDFSGYSDMAIGLGRMFGFKFLENFNYPYISKTATEYWLRWHISLGTWFRDYVYFPIVRPKVPGTRVSNSRIIWALFVVWSLTGLWHGANWTFIFWGWGYFILIVLEKFTNFHKKIGNFTYLYSFFVIIFFRVIFRAPTLDTTVDYYAVMLGFGNLQFLTEDFWFYLSSLKLYLFFGILFCFPVVNWAKTKYSQFSILNSQLLSSVVHSILFILCFMSVVKGGYNPFIYFNF